MSIFSKVSESITKQPSLTSRLFQGGWSQMGSIKHQPDTRTTEQLLENIEYYAKQCPEVAKFKNELKQMNPKYLGLVSDVCELANHIELLNTSIDMKKTGSNGKSLFETLLEKLPKASKENPESLELSKAIINNTDSIAAKYALASLFPLYECKDAAEHIKATVPLVGEIANATLKGGYTMDYKKENNFVNSLNRFISPDVQLDKLKILPQILKFAEGAKTMCLIEAFPFLQNKTAIDKVTENLETFKTLDKNMEGKTINLTEFLDKNINLK